jgi:hypothetical protein
MQMPYDSSIQAYEIKFSSEFKDKHRVFCWPYSP